MSPIVLIATFVVVSVIGYFLIRNVPSLLHTPLMSGMNALSGITILGALSIVALLLVEDRPVLGGLLGGFAVFLASINIVGGFTVTRRMLGFFRKKERRG